MRYHRRESVGLGAHSERTLADVGAAVCVAVLGRSHFLPEFPQLAMDHLSRTE